VYLILTTLDNVIKGELQRYENKYKVLNLITTALDRNVYDRLAHLKTAHGVWLKLCNTYDGCLKLNLLIRTPIIDSIRPFLRNLVNLLIIDLLSLSLSSVAYVLLVHLLILIMNVLNNYYMFFMILFGV
jgi:hypothetical protein